MDGDVIESTPIAVPVIAPSSQDRAAIESQQDAAWADDTTDTGADRPAPESDVVPAEEEGVIVDKPALASSVPAPKPGKTETVDEPAKTDEVKTEEITTETVTPEAKAESYWKKLTEVFPGAYAVSQSDKFKSWFANLSPADKAAAANLDDPDASIKIMGRYSDDVVAGRVAEPQPPAPAKAFEISEHIKTRNMDGMKIKLANGEETTLGAMAKPEEFGDIISAMGAMTEAAEKSVMSQATQLIQNLVDQGILVTGAKFNQLLERLGEKDLTTKVPDASTITNDPKFIEFRDKQPLLKKAWAAGDADSRAEVIAMFKADKARNTVVDTTTTQRRTNAAKNDLHKGSLRSGGAQGKTGDDGKSVSEQQDAAWDTPLEVEGQKV
ncbi:MAG: hypothetical protein WCI95_03130 [bacterium]